MTILGLVLSAASCSGLPAWACDAQLKTGLDPRLLYAICLVESSGNTKAYLPKDGKTASFGVCQIKLNTARGLGYLGTAQGLMQPSTNAHYAAKYMVQHLTKYKNVKKAVSAYNAGHAVTFNASYVERVMKNYRRLAAQ